MPYSGPPHNLVNGGSVYAPGVTPPTPAPAPASTSPPKAANGIVPSASEISRAITPESRHETHIIQQTATVEECFAHLQIVSGLVYVHGGDAAGVLAAAAGDCYIGRTRKFLTEVRAVGDQNVPFLINETSVSELQSARLYVSGTAGDRVTLIHR